MTNFNLSTQNSYDLPAEEMNTLLASQSEAEESVWFEVTDDFEFIDEEQKSEIREMEEDKKFYGRKG